LGTVENKKTLLVRLVIGRRSTRERLTGSQWGHVTMWADAQKGLEEEDSK